jgi:hypothetical protein
MAIQINNFSGGVAESKYQGVMGSYGASKGIDIYTDPGILTCAQKLTKDSGSTVTDLVLFSFQGTDGNTYFGGDSGKIYKRTSGGTWSNVRTESSRICGMIEYNGYFLWAISNKLFRMATGGNWTDGAVEVWNDGGTAWSSTLTNVTWTGDEVDANWHPMIVNPSGDLAVGAGQYVSVWNPAFGLAFSTVQGLDLPPDYSIKDLSYYRDDTVIGTWKGSVNNDLANIYRWDNNADSFQVPTTLNEGGVNSITSKGNSAVVQAGIDGALYFYDGAVAQLIRNIPGDYTAASYSDTYPQGMAWRESLLCIGHNDLLGSPSEHGVWTWGTLSNNLAPALNFTYPISTGNTSNVIIGSILQVGLDTYVSWKDTTSGTSYGVDIIDFNNKFDNATYETIVLGRGMPDRTYTKVNVSFEPLPSGCSIQLEMKANGAANWTGVYLPDNVSTEFATAGATTFTWPLNVTAQQIQFRLTLGASSNNAPRITSITIDSDEGNLN